MGAVKDKAIEDGYFDHDEVLLRTGHYDYDDNLLKNKGAVLQEIEYQIHSKANEIIKIKDDKTKKEEAIKALLSLALLHDKVYHSKIKDIDEVGVCYELRIYKDKYTLEECYHDTDIDNNQLVDLSSGDSEEIFSVKVND